MQLGLNKLPWYGQMLLFAVIGGAGIFSLPLLLRVEPCASELEEQRGSSSRASTRKSPRAAPPRSASSSSAPSSPSSRARFEALKAVVPEQRDVADMLRRIQTLATQSSLVVKAFRPQAVASKQLHQEWPMTTRARRHVSQPGALLRPGEQGAAHHQRRRHRDQGKSGTGHDRRHDHHGAVHGDDVRAARQAAGGQEAGPARRARGGQAADRRSMTSPGRVEQRVFEMGASRLRRHPVFHRTSEPVTVASATVGRAVGIALGTALVVALVGGDDDERPAGAGPGRATPAAGRARRLARSGPTGLHLRRRRPPRSVHRSRSRVAIRRAARARTRGSRRASPSTRPP